MGVGLKYSHSTAPRTPSFYMDPSAYERTLLWPTLYAFFKAHLDHYLIKLPSEDEPLMQPFPSQKYFSSDQLTPDGKDVSFFVLFGLLGGAMASTTYVLFLFGFARNNIAERESRLREMIRMMGMTDVVYWVNCLLVGLSTGIPICVILTLGLCTGEHAAIVFTDWSLVFTMLFVFTVGAILIVLVVCTLINSPNAGSLITILLVIGTCILYWAVLDRPMESSVSDYAAKPAAVKIFTSLIPFFGIQWLLKLIIYTEEIGKGLHWSTIGQTVIPGDNVSPLTILLTMIFSWGLYLLLTWYLDAVIPWQYGVPKEPFFFLHKSYWFCGKEQSVRSPVNQDDVEDFETVEPVCNAGEPVIRLRHVSHNFGPVRAVDDLSLDLYANQITMLLGHNGAGKTTAMNILTGLFPPTEGEVHINGYNVRKDTRRARSGIGLCLQHNVLFDELTVIEHLNFFASLKGVPIKANSNEIYRLLHKLGLSDKVETLAKNLSGGIKRKLSLANAMVGGSKILILDEPTTGMDPEARRGVWTLLQEERQNRTVLMTTHYMEEADVLGDRIAFLANGYLMCAGSPMFLKRKFETGYKLTFTKSHRNTDVQRVLTDVKQVLKANERVFITSNLGYEFCINIGFPENQLLIDLFKHLEMVKDNLEVEDIGISVTTMEDVFMKVGEQDVGIFEKTKDRVTHKMNGDRDAAYAMASFEHIARFNQVPPGFARTVRQLEGLLTKRFHAIRREWKMLSYLMLIPLIATCAYCVIADSGKQDDNQSVTYSLRGIYGETEGFVAGSQDILVDAFIENLKRDGVNCRKLPDDKVNTYLLNIGLKHPGDYKSKWSAGGQNSENRTLWFNGEPYHMGAAVLTRWQEAVLNKLTKKDAVVRVTNRPLERKDRSPPVMYAFLVHFKSTLFMAIVVSYLITSAIMFPVQERVTKSKLIQLMSGVSRLTYVASNLLFDMGIMLVPIMCMVVICVLINPSEGFRSYRETTVALFFILVTYGVSMLPFIYALAYLFKDSASALSALQVLSVVLVILVGPAIQIADLISVFNDTMSTYWIKLASFFPGFAAAYAFGNIHVNGQDKQICDRIADEDRHVFCPTILKELIEPCCHPCPGSPSGFCFQHTSLFTFDPRNGVMFQIMAMWVVGIFGFAFLVLMETYSQQAVVLLEFVNYQGIRNALSIKALRRRFGGSNFVHDQINDKIEPEDSDVINEQQHVDHAVREKKTNDYALLVHSITKYYGTFRAVNEVSFSVRNRECFGLLGVNGAGKSTIFGMLTGDLLLSGGNAYIQQSDLRTRLREFQGYIGYCPQDNALIDCMTGREMLDLFCALRGLSREQTPAIVDYMIELMNLTPHANKLTRTYSGGNKRKLSIAIAMIGNPRMLYLDEPTAGVDPIARRKIWATLVAAQRDLGSAVLLTSHSMEECEALCHRIGIMVAGTMRCLGSSQHLKEKYSQGFTVLVKLAYDSKELEDAVCACMHHLFSGQCRLKTNHQRLLKFHVTSLNLKWSEVFELILQLRTRSDLALEDIQVSDTTLEEVFLTFANARNSSSSNDEVIETREADRIHV
ncbi:ATP-binding cassette sub-family A member 1-like isoform X2 [Varroa destructor]|nr:ATP-binding cassette sub-family A member 1-like isoform X2 [Varroa destructor]